MCFSNMEKKKYNRKDIIKKILPNKNYKFVSKYQNPDIAIRRVGSKSGYIYYDNLNNKNNNTHYFIKIFKKYKKIQKLELNKEKKKYISSI